MSTSTESRSRRLRCSLRQMLFVALLIGVSGSLGCANGEMRWSDPFDRQLTFDEAQHRYTVLVRWAEFQKAKNFVEKEGREEFVKRMKSLDDARFTDYESESVELDDEKQTATVRVVYTLYLASSPYETEVTEIQDWSRSGVSNAWTVVSTFESLPSVASN